MSKSLSLLTRDELCSLRVAWARHVEPGADAVAKAFAERAMVQISINHTLQSSFQMHSAFIEQTILGTRVREKEATESYLVDFSKRIHVSWRDNFSFSEHL